MLFQRNTNHVLVSLKDKGTMVALEKILEVDIQRIQEEEISDDSEDDLAVAVDEVNLKSS